MRNARHTGSRYGNRPRPGYPYARRRRTFRWSDLKLLLLIVLLGGTAVTAYIRDNPADAVNMPRLFQEAASAPRNCTIARVRGMESIRRGEPGYAPHLDADGDGIACEPYPDR